MPDMLKFATVVAHVSLPYKYSFESVYALGASFIQCRFGACVILCIMQTIFLCVSSGWVLYAYIYVCLFGEFDVKMSNDVERRMQWLNN